MPLTLISTHTASSDNEVDITSGFSSSYSAFEFHCYNIHPSGLYHLGFQVNCSSGNTSGFNNIITSNYYESWQTAGSGAGNSAYQAAFDQDNADTALQTLATYVGGGFSVDADATTSGILTLYDPTNVDTMTHFISRFCNHYQENYFFDENVAGYINAEEPIDEIRFAMSSGTIDTGTIKMFGVS